MKTLKWIGPAVLAAGALIPSMASAQDVSKPYTLKLGAFFPSNGNLKDAVGNTWFSAGLDYTMSTPAVAGGQVNPIKPLLYVDYTGADKTVNGFKNEARVISVGIGGKYVVPQTGYSTVHPYLGAGIGAAFVHGKSSVTSTVSNGGQGTTTVTVSDTKDQTNFGFKVDGGLEFGQSYVVEVAYWNAGKVHDTTVDGVDASVGVKF